MRHVLSYLTALMAFPVLIGLQSCQEQDDTWDPYYNWQERNATWYREIADSARNAISEAKEKYGEAWESHCEWRMFQTFKKPSGASAVLEDSICVRILNAGTGSYSATYSDSIKLNFRGWIMPTEYLNTEGQLELMTPIFAQTYYGSYNVATSSPQVMAVKGTIDGFSTAMQYMVEGDEWIVYIPQELGYKAKSSSTIPAYSTLVYRMHALSIHR